MDRSIEEDGRQPGGPSGRSGSDGREADPRSRLQKAIDRAAQDQPAMSQLISRLEEAGVRAVPSLQKSGRLKGMSYVIDGILVRGSDLGTAYTVHGLQTRRGVRCEPDRDQPRLIEATERAKEYTSVDRFRGLKRARRDKLRDRHVLQ